MKNTFGNILKQVRRSQNMSQRELAEKVGIDFSYISKIENDRIPPPAADTILKISSTLNAPVELLLSHSGKVTNDLKDFISSNVEALRFLNEVKDMQLTNKEWKTLSTKLKKLR